MSKSRLALKVSGTVFLLVALAHLARLVFKFNLVVGDTVVPVWANALGLGLALALSLWTFSSAKE